MSSYLKPYYVGQLQIASSSATIGTSAPTSAFQYLQFPTGNLLVHDLLLSFWGNLNLTTASAGTIVTDGEKLFFNGIRVFSDMHGDLMQSLDLLSLFRINLFLYGGNVAATAISAATTGTPAFRVSVRLPFALRYGTRWESRRPNDTILDLIKSRLKIYVTTGDVTKFITGGTYTVETVQVANLDVDSKIFDNPPEPQDPSSSLFPGYMSTFDVVDYPVSATAKRTAIPIPTGDGLIEAIFISQRNLSTLAELTNIIGATDLVEVKVQTESIMTATPWAQLQDRNAQDFDITTPPGWACIRFNEEGTVNKMLDARGIANGTMFLYADVTTQTNGGLRVIVRKVKPIPGRAERDYMLAVRAQAAQAAGAK